MLLQPLLRQEPEAARIMVPTSRHVRLGAKWARAARLGAGLRSDGASGTKTRRQGFAGGRSIAMHAMPTSGQLLTIDDFAGHLGGIYRADATPAPVDLRLDGIERTPANPLGLRDPFTLVFSTPFAALLTAGFYQLRAPCGRVVAIDLIPTQSMPGPRRSYHAVFT